MICFYDQTLRSFKPIFNFISNHTKISTYRNLGIIFFKIKAHRLCSVMRYVKTIYLKIIKTERAVCLYFIHQLFITVIKASAFSQFRKCSKTCKNRNFVFFHKHHQSVYMVSMFMCNENSFNTFCINRKIRQTFHYPFTAYSAVYKKVISFRIPNKA